MGESSACIAYPRVTDDHLMEAFACSSDDLNQGTHGIMEPPATAQLIRPEDIDVVLVPGVAFDRQGYRIGYGKGYYDTYLPRLGPDALTIGLSYDQTMVDKIACELHDIAVDVVITPSAIYSSSDVIS
jgi:5-formyltetrahydrofolate cyclo-ligase